MNIPWDEITGNSHEEHAKSGLIASESELPVKTATFPGRFSGSQWKVIQEFLDNFSNAIW